MHLRGPDAVLAALSESKRWRRWALEALIFLAVVIGLSVWQNRGLPEGAAPPLQGIRSDGVQVDGAGSAAAKQGKATLVVFWASWCPVCAAQAGNIEAIADDWPVLSVAMQSGNAATIRQYLNKHGLKLAAVVDEDGNIAAGWRARSVPTHFIIDPSGNIRFRVVGYATEIGLRARLWWASAG